MCSRSTGETGGCEVLTVGSLFTGIGGLDLGLERAGMQVIWQCETDPYCRAVLKRHWPDVPCYPDVRELRRSGSILPVNLICGGSPCQPVSSAGKGLAQEDQRWLWPEFARIVGEFRPQFVLLENVSMLRTRGLRDVITDLAEMGYDAEWELVSAAACGAPHLRERYFVLGYANDEGESDVSVNDEASRMSGLVADTNRSGCDGWPRHFTEENWRTQSPDGDWWASEPRVDRVANGIPNRMDRIRTLGNAVVPQVAEAVGRMILASL